MNSSPLLFQLWRLRDNLLVTVSVKSLVTGLELVAEILQEVQTRDLLILAVLDQILEICKQRLHMHQIAHTTVSLGLEQQTTPMDVLAAIVSCEPEIPPRDNMEQILENIPVSLPTVQSEHNSHDLTPVSISDNHTVSDNHKTTDDTLVDHKPQTIKLKLQVKPRQSRQKSTETQKDTVETALSKTSAKAVQKKAAKKSRSRQNSAKKVLQPTSSIVSETISDLRTPDKPKLENQLQTPPKDAEVEEEEICSGMCVPI
ncbi:hypothetical protein EDD86DRAFT_211022 [Gorgonomyces haynaldii]|nr:hypothetical protein EDD86DRAFT_211022 [Gorgonomyces haynaldii]